MQIVSTIVFVSTMTAWEISAVAVGVKDLEMVRTRSKSCTWPWVGEEPGLVEADVLCSMLGDVGLMNCIEDTDDSRVDESLTKYF